MGKKAASSKPADKTGNQSPEDDYVADGEAALAAIEPKLLALPSDSITYVNVDVQVAAVAARGVARTISKDATLRARFEALAAAKEFDLAHLKGLETGALAAWFARHRLLLASATQSEAQLPASLVAAAMTLKARMMRVVEYHLGDHPKAGPIVAAIRAGTGYMDLANDLIALARLYKTYAKLLAHDKKDYQATDQNLAAKTGDQIVVLLEGSTPEQRKWADLQARAWTWLNRAYDEVSEAGRYLKRHDADVDSAFPSLVTASRAESAKSAGPKEGPAAPLAESGGATP